MTARIFPIIIAFLLLTSCGTRRELHAVSLAAHGSAVEHSPSVFILMYDKKTGKGPLQEAVKAYNAGIVYDYDIHSRDGNKEARRQDTGGNHAAFQEGERRRLRRV